jgi:nucleotide-binding universal stress UspA family protein
MLPIRTILHPTDFSEQSEGALELASVLARDCNARLIVVHVNPPQQVAVGEFGLTPPQPVDEADELRDRLFGIQPRDKTIPLEHFFLNGDPARQIVKLAGESNCDLIVMGTHGRSGVGRVFLGSVAEEVMRNAPCPVVTLKHPIAAFARANAEAMQMS